MFVNDNVLLLILFQMQIFKKLRYDWNENAVISYDFFLSTKPDGLDIKMYFVLHDAAFWLMIPFSNEILVIFKAFLLQAI